VFEEHKKAPIRLIHEPRKPLQDIHEVQERTNRRVELDEYIDHEADDEADDDDFQEAGVTGPPKKSSLGAILHIVHISEPTSHIAPERRSTDVLRGSWGTVSDYAKTAASASLCEPLPSLFEQGSGDARGSDIEGFCEIFNIHFHLRVEFLSEGI
jgi:hypothetical protein